VLGLAFLAGALRLRCAELAARRGDVLSFAVAADADGFDGFGVVLIGSLSSAAVAFVAPARDVVRRALDAAAMRTSPFRFFGKTRIGDVTEAIGEIVASPCSRYREMMPEKRRAVNDENIVTL
jgi:hypothetical protein